MNLKQAKEYCLSLKEVFLCMTFDEKTEVIMHMGEREDVCPILFSR